MKLCKKCGLEKEDILFANPSWCRECVSSYNKEYAVQKSEELKSYRRKNKDKHNEQVKAWHKKNKDKVREHQKKSIRTPKGRFRKSKQIAKSRNIEWFISFTEYEYLIKLSCHYCDGYFGKVETGLGLDRINNNLGYQFDNVVSCCYSCNKVKSNVLTYEETKEVIKLVLRMRQK